MPTRRTRSFREIAHIRALQRQADEMRLGRSTAALDEQLGLQKEEQRAQDGRERQWSRTLDNGFDLTLCRAWSSAVTVGLQRLAEADTAVSDARQETRRAGEALQAAQARAEAADALKRRAIRRDRLRREDQALFDVSDLFLGRSGHED